MDLKKQHIDDRTLVRLARSQVSGEEYEELMAHIIGCDDCRFKYVTLRKYMESGRNGFRIPVLVSRIAYVFAAFLLFLFMNIFSHRAVSDHGYAIPARYASDTTSLRMDALPKIKYIYIDTLALHIFYLRGENALFRFQFEPHGNIIKVKAKPSR